MPPSWPDAVALKAFLGKEATLNAEAASFAVTAAQGICEARFYFDEDGETDDNALAESVALLTAARLYRRKDSPEGIIGSNDFGTVRVTRFDPDIESMAAPVLDWSVG